MASPHKKGVKGSKRLPALTSPDQPYAVFSILRDLYPEADCALIHRNPFELLVATVLSAQTTDVGVNKVTPTLFNRWPTPQALSTADVYEVEQTIRTIGFFRTKAANIVALSAQLIDDFGGEVPVDLDDLTTLPGVGRKTAHVVRGHAFKLPAITTDTHVMRLSRRLGWTKESKPVPIEMDLATIFHPQDWMKMCDSLIWHGRAICKARKADCEHCPLSHLCPAIGV